MVFSTSLNPATTTGERGDHRGTAKEGTQERDDITGKDRCRGVPLKA